MSYLVANLGRMPTPDMFDFDADRLDDYDPLRVAEALEEHPALYVNHLQLAQYLQSWRESVEEDSRFGGDPAFKKGYVDALNQVAAHLRQADYLPTGSFLGDVRAARERDARLGPASPSIYEASGPEFG